MESPSPRPDSATYDLSRRGFVKGTLAAAGGVAIASTAGASASVPASPASGSATHSRERRIRPEEWRNRQAGMTYRRLGDTGLMLSELVQGGSGPYKLDEMDRFLPAIERGMNYFDTASRYSGGESEQALGQLLAQPGMRDRLFISTKLSEYLRTLDRVTREIFDGLPGEKKEALRKKATEMAEERQVTRPGYFFHYFNGIANTVESGYLTQAIKQEYGFQAKWKKVFKDEMREVLHRSLTRLNTDHVDVLHCPHGARLPEELDDEVIRELFDEFRQAGKARFFGLSAHTDPPRLLRHATDVGCYDLVMCAYNIANQGTMDEAVRHAHDQGVGVIAMKVLAALNPISEQLKPAPSWREQKLHHVLPGEMPLGTKAYLWALQNPYLSAVISEMYNSQQFEENVAAVGRKVELLPA